MQLKPGQGLSACCSVLAFALLCGLVTGQRGAAPPAPPPSVGISAAWPSSLNIFVQTVVRVTLNTSACSQLGQDAADGAQLVLQHVTAKGGSLAFKRSAPAGSRGRSDDSSSSSSSNGDCTSFDFPVLLDGTSKHGNITARLLLPKAGLDLQLQEPIMVSVPLLLSVTDTALNVSADSTPFTVGVGLSRAAPAGGVTVRLQVDALASTKVEPEALYWPEGAAGRRDFTIMLLSAPEDSVLTARLVNPSGGAVLHPTAAAVQATVQSPVVAFQTNVAYYRGLNSSSIPQLTLTVTGSSAFPSEFAFSTFLLPGSRPSPLPCHPLAPSCSVADQEAVENVTVTANRQLFPGQSSIQPVGLPLSWGRLPPEAELRVGMQVICIRNCRAAEQQDAVAAIIFGTPPGHCPPGAVLASGEPASNSSNSSSSTHSNDRPTYTHVAALQELTLVLERVKSSGSDSSQGGAAHGGANRHRSLLQMSSRTVVRAAANRSSAGRGSGVGVGVSAGSNSSSNATRLPRFVQSSNRTGSNSSKVPGAKGVAVTASTAAAAKATVRPSAAAASSSDDSSSSLDLDPPFRPLGDRYIALLPPGPAAGQLMMSSSRWGDAVVVDTTACGELDSVRYTVAWETGQQLWREYYSLAGQKTPCWIRVHVFTRLGDGSSSAPQAAAAPPAAAAGDDGGLKLATEPGLNARVGLKEPAAMAPAAAAAGGGPSRRPLQVTEAASATGRDSSNASSGSSNASSSNSSSSSIADPDDGDAGSSAGSSSSSSSPSVWDLPASFVLYRSYTIRFIPLRPPEQLSLRAITFTNNASVVIACGVPSELQHLFVSPPSLQVPGSGGSGRGSSIMSSNFAAASSRAPGGEQYNSTAGRPPAAGTAAATAAKGSTYRLEPAGSAAQDGLNAAPAGASSSSGSGPPPALVTAPGVDVQVAYLHMKPPGSNSTTAAQDMAAAAKLPKRLRLQQFSVFDHVSSKTVLWSRYTSAECAQDRYILLPMAQLKSDMKMVPELLDPEGMDAGVKISTSPAAVALPGGLVGNGSSTGSSATGSGSSSSHLGVPGEGRSSSSSWALGQKLQGSGYGAGNPIAALAAAAAVDGGKGFGGAGLRNIGVAGCGSGGNSSSSSARSAQGIRMDTPSSSTGGSSDVSCALQLPGLTAELPIILTADEGRSSKTYTMLLYSNATAAAAVQELVLPQEAAAAGSRSSNGSNSQAADAAALTAAYFADRPSEWPKPPAQSSMCSVCPNGTYSTKTDALECKVCPPGKYSAAPFSTTCLYCPPGTFSYYWGAPACRTCLPGTYAAAAGSLFCDICRDGTTTRGEGATECELAVAGGVSPRLEDTVGSSDVAVLLSFGLVLEGTNLESVSRSLTGINGSSEGIVGVLVRGDTASALNISLGSVQVLAVQQVSSRQLLVNVSAALPMSTDQAAAAAQQDLSADPLIQRLIDDPNTFLRTTQTLGAESASVQDITTQMTQRAKWRRHLQLHAVLWPCLVGFLLLLGLGSWGWRRRRRRQLQLVQIASGRPDLDPTAALAPGGLGGGLFGASLQQRSIWGRRTAAAAGAAASGSGWFYGDGFMTGGTGAAVATAAGAAAAAAGAAPELTRMSVTSSDAGEGNGHRGVHGVRDAMRLMHRLLSSQIRIVFKVRASSAGRHAGEHGSGASSPFGSSGSSSNGSSPGRSSCGASDSDCMERGVDECRVKVVLGGSDGGSGAADGGSDDAAAYGGCSLRQHGLYLQEESFAARLRANQQQRLQ